MALNEMQQLAVDTTEGPLLILAGAGSGKTTVLVNRVEHIISSRLATPWQVLAITFTNKAAGELRERLVSAIGDEANDIWAYTFHSCCSRILRRFGERIGYTNHFTIYDTDDSRRVMKQCQKQLGIEDKLINHKSILAEISRAKDSLISPDEYKQTSQNDFRKSKIAECYEMYQKELKKSDAMDFDDIIFNTVKLLEENEDVRDLYQTQFKYVMVDEYQDTNTAQFQLIRLLAEGSRNICVVGDDDQSIYKFRGANIRNILDFEKYYPEAVVIRLEQNYRSTQNVLDAANAVIRNNVGRKSKTLWTDKGAGNRIHYRQFDNAYEEAEFIADDISRKIKDGIVEAGECAVLFRTNAQARLLEERFVVEGIPYDVVGGTNFYARREIKDLLSYLKTVDNARDDLAVKRIINVPKRGIGAATIAKVDDYAQMHEISFYEALCHADEIQGLGKAEAKIRPFVNMIQVFRSRLSYYSLKELMHDILDTTNYINEMDVDDEIEAQSRIDNIDELINKIVAYEEANDEPSLSAFLEEVALVADIDRLSEDDNRVLLMTLHSAKGLEFSHVYLAGMEDGIFPSYMTIASDDPAEIEEERRLAYVGITRAKDDLTLCYAKMRMVRGETQMNAVSRFVKEIPPELMDNKPPAPRYQPVVADKSSRTISVPKKPYLASAGTGSFGALGISKGSEAVKGGKPDYDIGDRVRHVKYGEGFVTDLEPGPRDYKVTVDFDDAGQKIMYAAFAKLEKI